MATRHSNLISDLRCDVIIDSSTDFFALERVYDIETESFMTIDPLAQMCQDEDTDGYDLWLEMEHELEN